MDTQNKRKGKSSKRPLETLSIQGRSDEVLSNSKNTRIMMEKKRSIERWLNFIREYEKEERIEN